MIEKLGIEPLELKSGKTVIPVYLYYDIIEVNELQQQRNVLLEVLIEQAKIYEEIFGYGYKCRNDDYDKFAHWIKLIEKTTKMKWDKIKELLK